MTSSRQRAIAIAHRWLSRADINPDGELAIVARALLDEAARQDDAALGVVELPPWPFDRKVETNG